MNTVKPYDITVLNTIQASAADLAHAKRLLTCTGLNSPIDSMNSRAKKYAYAAGTAAVKDRQITDQASGGPNANGTKKGYVLTVRLPKIGYVRNFTWVSGSSAPTAQQVVEGLVDAVGAVADAANYFTAALQSTDKLRITEADAANGEIFFDVNGVAPQTVVTAHVEPSGTPSQIQALISGTDITVSDTAQYTIWAFEEIIKDRNTHAVFGNVTGKRVMKYIVADAGATNYAEFATKIDAVIGGTDTAANYLGSQSL